MSIIPEDDISKGKFFLIVSLKSTIKHFVSICLSFINKLNPQDTYKTPSIILMNKQIKHCINNFEGGLTDWNNNPRLINDLNNYRRTFCFLLDNDRFYRGMTLLTLRQLFHSKEFQDCLSNEKLNVKL